MDPERERQLREYADGNVTWHTLQRRGLDSYIDVLAGLGELGLRPPVAPLDGPNAEARTRGRALVRQLLQEQTSKKQPIP
jgi:hypothetical protein